MVADRSKSGPLRSISVSSPGSVAIDAEDGGIVANSKVLPVDRLNVALAVLACGNSR